MILIHKHMFDYYTYRKTSNISRTLVGNKIVDHWCSWSIACRHCSNYIFILDLTPGFKGFGKDSRKTVLESFNCWDLVRLILETWRYIITTTSRKGEWLNLLWPCDVMWSTDLCHHQLQWWDVVKWLWSHCTLQLREPLQQSGTFQSYVNIFLKKTAEIYFFQYNSKASKS